MSTTKHTAEPWLVETRGDEHRILDSHLQILGKFSLREDAERAVVAHNASARVEEARAILNDIAEHSSDSHSRTRARFALRALGG